MLYLVLSNEQRNLFSGVSCHGNQENSVFVVSVTAIAKGKNPSAYFRKLTRASSQWEFQHKVSITSLEKVLEPVPLLPITRDLDPTIFHINSETNSFPQLSMLFASIWDSFLVQAPVLLLFQNAATLNRRRGASFISEKWAIPEFP